MKKLFILFSLILYVFGASYLVHATTMVLPYMQMKETIINRATSLFLTLGFKSVTMDDIANELGMSKKTIYTYFDNKTSLVEAGTTHLFKKITDGINDIKTKSLDPITELHDIKIFLMNSLKGDKTSPYYQLQKYCPSIHKELKIKKFDFVLESTKKSLQLVKNLLTSLYYLCKLHTL